jgi:hypothetical protein
MGYVVLYIIGAIVTIILESYISVKFEADFDVEFIPVLVLLTVIWPVSLPIGLIAFGSYKLWKYSTNYFNKVVKNKIR